MERSLPSADNVSATSIESSTTVAQMPNASELLSRRPTASAPTPMTPSQRLWLNTGSSDVFLGSARAGRADSRMAFLHCTCSWLPTGIWVLFFMMKLSNRIYWPWWCVFMPAWIGHALQLLVFAVQFTFADYFIRLQIGPPPPPAMNAMHHYDAVRQTRMRAFLVDNCSGLVECICLWVAKALLCLKIDDIWTGVAELASLKVIAAPFCVSWVATSVLALMKDRVERMCCSSRDLHFLFVLFVAFKLDERSTYSWRIVFVIVFVWFCVLFLLALAVLAMIVYLLRMRRVRLRELLMPLGFLALIAAFSPQFASYYRLACRLDGDTGISYAAIMLPNAVSWLAMWAASALLALGLHYKELARAELLASGAMWAEAGNSPAVQNEIRAAQQKVDAMSEAEVEELVAQLLEGKPRPLQLVQVGQLLFRRVQEAPVLEEADPERGMAPGVAGETAAQGMALVELQPQREGAAGGQVPRDAVVINIPGAVAQSRSMTPQHSGGIPALHGSSSDAAACSGRLGASSSGAPLLPLLSVSAVEPAWSPPAHPEPPGHSGDPGAAPSRPSFAARVLQSATDRALQSISGGSFSGGVAEARPEAVAGLRADSGAPAARTSVGSEVPGSSQQQEDEATCIICYDAPPRCVFLECGHGGVCRPCAFRLFVRPPNECPTCRQRITQVVELEAGAASSIGDVLRVKQ